MSRLPRVHTLTPQLPLELHFREGVPLVSGPCTMTHPLSCLTSEGPPHLLGKEVDRPISKGIHLNPLLDDKS